MSLNNFHTNNYIGGIRPIYPSEQQRMDVYGLAYNQPRDWDTPNRVPVPKMRPADPTSKLVSWLRDIRNTEFRSNGLTKYYTKISGTRSFQGDNAESLLLTGRSTPTGRFSRYFRSVPY
jgi:hypothetical protein